MYPYIIKSFSILVILFVYYQLFLKKQTFFNLNRIYLLATLFIAVCVPFIHITLNNQENPATIYYVANILEEVYVQGDSLTASTWEEFLADSLPLLYILGVIFFTGRYILALIRLRQLIKNNPHKYVNGIYIVHTGNLYPTFSFFNYLFINDTSLNKEGRRKVLEHEKIHIRQLHSIDLLIAELICITNWFNPMVWLFKSAISQNHEYIADKQVIRRFQTGSYLQLLVSQAFKGAFSFTNCFSCSNLQKRMIMMTKQQSKKYRIINYIPALLIAGILFINFTCKATLIPVANDQQISDNELYTDTPSVSDTTTEIFEVVENMPKFPDGNVQAWIVKNIKYPTEAVEKNIQGKVFLQFIIEKDGSVSDVKVLRGVDALLDKEAIRVVRTMPKWIPGKQKGEIVRVRYALPINFALSTPKSDKDAAPKADENPENIIFQVVEDMPKFEGGSVQEWLAKNIKYPEEAVKEKAQGKVFVQFIIDKTGIIKEPKIIRSSGNQSLDAEALRVTGEMPKWIPGKQRGQNVNVAYTLPIQFQIPTK